MDFKVGDRVIFRRAPAWNDQLEGVTGRIVETDVNGATNLTQHVMEPDPGQSWMQRLWIEPHEVEPFDPTPTSRSTWTK